MRLVHISGGPSPKDMKVELINEKGERTDITPHVLDAEIEIHPRRLTKVHLTMFGSYDLTAQEDCDHIQSEDVTVCTGCGTAL